MPDKILPPIDWATRCPLPNKDDFLRSHPWIDPYLYPYPHYPPGRRVDYRQPYKPEVYKLSKGHSVMAVFATHKTFGVLPGIEQHHVESIDGVHFELYNCHERGVVDGVEYLWGSPVLGLGLIDCCIMVDWARELTAAERAHWARAELTMVGSHTGRISQTGLRSGIEA